MSFVWDYKSAFEVAYSRNISEEEKDFLFETLGIPEGLETIQEASSQVGFLVDFLDSIVFSEVSEATADDLIDKVIGGLSEAAINEVSDEFIKRHARNALANRKREFNAHKEPIGMVGLEKNARAEERLNRAKELSKKAPERTFKSQPSSKLKGAVKKVKDWFNQPNDHVSLSKIVGKKPAVKPEAPKPVENKPVENKPAEPKKSGANIVGATEKKPNLVKNMSSTISVRVKNPEKEEETEPNVTFSNTEVGKGKEEKKPEVEAPKAEKKPAKPRKTSKKETEKVEAPKLKKVAKKQKPVKAEKVEAPKPVEKKPEVEAPKEEAPQPVEAKTESKPKKPKRTANAAGKKQALNIVSKIRAAQAKKQAEKTEENKPQSTEANEQPKQEAPKAEDKNTEPKKEMTGKEKYFARQRAQHKKGLREKISGLQSKKASIEADPNHTPQQLEDINKQITSAEAELQDFVKANEALVDFAVLLAKSNISESSFVEVMKMIRPNKENTTKIQERYEKELDEALDEICKDAVAGNPINEEKIKEAENIEKRKEHFEEMLKKRFNEVN